MLVKLTEARFLVGLELEMVECEYLMGGSGKIAKGKRDLEDQLKKIMENLGEREVDCGERMSQGLGQEIHRRMIMLLGVLVEELEVR